MSHTRGLRLLGCFAIAAGLCGCNIGMAPSGGSDAQIEANFKNESPQDQIRTIQMSPASPDKKAQLINEIKAKYGIKDDTTQPGGPQAGGPPQHQ